MYIKKRLVFKNGNCHCAGTTQKHVAVSHGKECLMQPQKTDTEGAA